MMLKSLRPLPRWTAMLIMVCIGMMLSTPSFEAMASSNTRRASKKSAKVDYLALAAILLRDGHLKRAQRTLAQISVATLKKKPAKKARFHTLWGLLSIKQKAYRRAARHLRLAIKTGQNAPKLFLLLAKARFQLGDYKGTLRALAQAPRTLQEQLGAYLLKIQSLWRQKDLQGAYQVLSKGRARYPDSFTMMRLQILLFIDLKLYQAAIKIGHVYLERKAVKVTDYLVIAEALRRGKQPKLAALLLEEALLRFPHHSPLMVQLSRIYIDLKKPLIAAGLLERVAKREEKWLPEAAELYRRARHYWSAMHLNAQILLQKKKIPQRMGLLLELHRYEEVAAMEQRLARLGLLKDQKLSYALAYAYFKIRRFRKAEKWLKPITQPSLFQKAIALRKAMQTCQSKPDGCL